jgi:hypothetical protein
MDLRRSRRNSSAREGVACVELAITIPLLIFVIFVSIQIAEQVATGQLSSRIAYHVARQVDMGDLSESEAERLGQKCLNDLKRKGKIHASISRVSDFIERVDIQAEVQVQQPMFRFIGKSQVTKVVSIYRNRS